MFEFDFTDDQQPMMKFFQNPLFSSNDSKIVVVDPDGEIKTFSNNTSLNISIFEKHGKYKVKIYGFDNYENSQNYVNFKQIYNFPNKDYVSLSDCYVIGIADEYKNSSDPIYYNQDSSKNNLSVLNYYSDSLVKWIKIPDTLNQISSYFYNNATNLENIYFSNSGNLSSIGYNAFDNCYGIQTLLLPHGLKIVGSCAFEHAEQLNFVYFPSSLTAIGDYAFKLAMLNDDSTVICENAEMSNCITIKDAVEFIQNRMPKKTIAYTDEMRKQYDELVENTDRTEWYKYGDSHNWWATSTIDVGDDDTDDTDSN